MSARTLHQGLLEAAVDSPARTAVIDPSGPSLSYADLERESGRVLAALRARGCEAHDRVGVYLPKSTASVLSICGVLRAGAAYVPLDPEAPTSRAAFIAHDCRVRLVITSRQLAEPLRRELDRLGGSTAVVMVEEILTFPIPSSDDPAPVISPDQTACILYTSGSSGTPKGVVVSHRAACAFVDWATAAFAPQATDRFSSHAPFHFDLSIFDLFVPQAVGAAVVLLSQDLIREPRQVARVLVEERITVWYSTPSALVALERHGRLERWPDMRLRIVMFAGEVYPMAALRRLRTRWPGPRLFNLYGPTETNVCTWYEVPHPISDDDAPLPIGRACAHCALRVLEGDHPVPPGKPGELVVSGPGLMSGYWNQPQSTRDAFLVDELGVAWYRTGDIVSEQPDGNLRFHGRRDRMIKRHGYRVEPAEIEAVLARHPGIDAVAVIPEDGTDGAPRIVAFLVRGDPGHPGVLDLKQFAAQHLPRYMVPDRFAFVASLPRTSTGKTDYRRLATTIRDQPADEGPPP